MINLFKQLKEVDNYSWKWEGKQTINFGDRDNNITVLIQGNEQDKVTDRQKEVFDCFMRKWIELQGQLIDKLIRYYNDEEKLSYGPENEEELQEWWPEINTKENLLENIKLESIVIPEDYRIEKDRIIYLVFSKNWGGEDLEDNGIGICIINEEMTEIGYKEIAF